MNIVVSILSRATVDQDFSQLVAPAVLALTGDAVGFTPVLPVGSDALDLRLRVAPENGVSVVVGQWVDPAHPPVPTPILDGGGNVIGETPAPTPTASKRCGIWGGQTRDIPFGSREAFLFQRSGAA